MMCYIEYVTESDNATKEGDLMFDMIKAGEKIKELRKKKGYTPEKVAKDIGVSVSSYNKYEQGRRKPRDEIKEKIANYYNESIGSIFFNY